MDKIDYELLFMDAFATIARNVPVCCVFKLSTKHPSVLLYSIAGNDKDICVYINDKKKGIRSIDTIRMDVYTPLHCRVLNNIRYFVSKGSISIETFTYYL